jgi:nitroreductase
MPEQKGIAMDTLTTILERRSVRTYKNEPIPAADLKQILEAGHQAPSAANRQPWHYVIVGDPAQKARVAYIIVAVGRPQVTEKWFKVDVAIALQTMVLAAASLGYGTCWIGAFEDQNVRAVCGIPEDLTVVACSPLGVPDAHPPARQRKDWDEVFSLDRYGEPLRI